MTRMADHCTRDASHADVVWCACAHHARAGGTVVACGRTDADLDELVRHVAGLRLSGTLDVVRADVAKESDRTKLMEAATAVFASKGVTLSVLVNNVREHWPPVARGPSSPLTCSIDSHTGITLPRAPDAPPLAQHMSWTLCCPLNHPCAHLHARAAPC